MSEYERTFQEGEEVIRVPLPNRKKGEMFGIVDRVLGGRHLQVMCEDGKSRLARIPGRIRRRMWIKEGDLVILRPWEFQDEKADIVYRYNRTQVSHLSRNGLLPEILDVF